MPSLAGMSISRCRCLFYGNAKSKGPEQQPELTTSATTANSNTEVPLTDPSVFLFTPNKTEEEAASAQTHPDDRAANTAISAVVPILAGLAVTTAVAAGVAAAAPLALAASGVPTLAAVITGSALAAMVGLGASAYVDLHFERGERAKLFI